jgi:tetratricopeptide (TPR) repeat protein
MRKLSALVLVLAATAVSFAPVSSERKEFTNWDDQGYVTAQPLVRSLSVDTLQTVFDRRTHVMFNYHPLTVLSLALNHRLAGLDVRPYALTNLALHLVNTLLVFVFLHRLAGGRVLVGLLGALWFGIHPMHVESVAWISGRKDLLYACFFLLACIAYLRYLGSGRALDLVLTFVAFVLSCLSKGMAVPLPFVLLLLDAVHGRKLGAGALLEKVPFVAVAAWFAWVGVQLQAILPIVDFEVFTPLERLALAAYGFVLYWVKLVVPWPLSAFYPTPDRGEGHGLPLGIWLMPALALALVMVPLVVAYRWDRRAFRVVGFGLGFFVLMLVLVLQFFSFGSALMADRYTYVAYIGAFFMLASAVDALWARGRWRPWVATGVAAYSLCLGVATWRRTWVWTTSETLWSDVIAKYPFRLEERADGVVVLQHGVATAYENRGNYYRERGQMDLAIRDYELLVKAQVRDGGPYVNMGNVHGERGDALLRQNRRQEAAAEFARALEMYSMAMARGASPFETHLNRGITYAAVGMHEQALADLRTALRLNPSAPGVRANVAFLECQLKRWEECIQDATAVVAESPADANGPFLRGLAYMNTGRIAEALADLQRAVTLAPGLGMAWHHLAVLYAQAGNTAAADEAASRARAAGQAAAGP